jgi:GLE1-like protein
MSWFLFITYLCYLVIPIYLQSEIEGVNKPYGLKEGWSWIAMILNHLPVTSSTAVALEAFLKVCRVNVGL